MPSDKVTSPVRINLTICVGDLQIFLFFKTFVFFFKGIAEQSRTFTYICLLYE